MGEGCYVIFSFYIITVIVYENKKGIFLIMFGGKKKRYKKFFKACRKGDLATVRDLSSHKDIDTHDQNEYALRLAVEYGHLDIARYLISECDADVHVDDEIILRNAVGDGNLQTIKYLVEECGADIHADNEAALNDATQGQLDVVKYLVEDCGADVHMNNERALHNAVRRKNMDVIQYLVEECDADINIEDGQILCTASIWSDIKIVEYLVKQGGDIEALREKKPSVYIKALDWRQEYRMKQGVGWQKTGADEVGFYEEKKSLSRGITKTFNFKAKEITTISRNTITDAESLFIQAFDEVRNQDIITQAYEKLKEFDPETTVKYSTTNNMVRVDKRSPSEKAFKIK